MKLVLLVNSLKETFHLQSCRELANAEQLKMLPIVVMNFLSSPHTHKKAVLCVNSREELSSIIKGILFFFGLFTRDPDAHVKESRSLLILIPRRPGQKASDKTIGDKIHR